MAQRGMKFGIFLAPFHRLGENPTLAMARDMELIEWLDWLGYDEAWIGEHHSAGWEVVASPEIFIAEAAHRTRNIMLGSGVTSLPYHHPFLVAQTFVQLNHMTRGRVMLGVGPGALPSDAYMMGIEPVDLRRRMEESLEAIIRLLRCDEPVTMSTDWFQLREARLHLAPYSDPRFHIAVASTITPFGMVAAGKHGLGVLSIGAGLPVGPEAMASQWKIAEETVGRVPGTSDDPVGDGVKALTTLVGSPDTAIRVIERLLAASDGGFGGMMFRAHEWANREDTLKSYELFARYVMPRFQGSADTLIGSNQWIRGDRRRILGNNVEAVRRAFTDTGRSVPDEYRF